MKNLINFSTPCIIFLLLTTLTYSQTIDYGDAPDPKYPNLSITYPTLMVNGGASHPLDGTTFLGTLCDAELDGQPHPHAQGDDNLGVNDDDGVVFTSVLMPGGSTNVSITASASGFLNAWIDFNFNGSWADPGEHIFVDATLSSGTNSLVFTVPGSAVNSISYARFRFSSLGGISFNGPALNGEVEDYEVIIGEPYDFGDAPDPNYPTLALNNGAAHLMDGITYMGIDVDAEPDGQQGTNAVGDDQDGNDDNDGVVFNSWLNPGFNASVIVIASVAGFVDAWIDYNSDGDWADAGEQIFTSTSIGAGYNNLTFMVDATAPTGVTYTRFRFSSTGGLSPTGLAPDGEVEDYQVYIGIPTAFPDIIIDPDPTYKHVQNEISLTLLPNTSCGDVLAAAYNDHPYPGGPGLGISYNHSNTGGIWNNTHLAYPPNPYGGCQFLDAFDPTITKDSCDNLYAAFISSSFYWNPAPATGIYVCKSTDYGVNWGAPVTVATNGYPTSNPDANYRFNDRCQITADIYPNSTYYNNIYLVWIKDRGLNQSSPFGDIYFSMSSDAGVTFSPEITLNNPANNMGNMPIPTVAKDGTLYVCWVDCDVTIQTGDPNADMRFNVSSDGGVTWGTDTFIATFDLPPRNLNNLTDARAFGASVIRALPSNPNVLYIVYAADPDGAGGDEADIYFIKSTDGGSSWSSSPIRVNDDFTTYDQILPWMEVKPNGVIDIVWYDRRNDPSDLIWDVYFACSTDGGNSFSTNVPVNQSPFTTPNTPLSGSWMGEYLGLAVDYPIAHTVHTTSIFDPLGDVCYVTNENPELNIDWGDAPDPSYPTLAINNGANHQNDGITWLGILLDAEPDGQPNGTATGDDIGYTDDEDGVIFLTAMVQGATVSITVTANCTGTAYLNAWMDFNANNSWGDPGEQIFTDAILNNGVNNLNFNIPTGAAVGTTYSRFRFSTTAGLGFTGSASSGEVEDYEVYIEEYIDIDYGDAPPPFPTLLANIGASHVISSGVFLGLSVDPEFDGQPNANASGDDIDGNDDEDGVVFITPLALGNNVNILVTASMPGFLNAWVDFNGNSSWADAGDQIFTNQPVSSGPNSLFFTVPSSAAPGNTYLRFRYCLSTAVVTYTGQAPDGEVEDYEKWIHELDYGDAPDPTYPTQLANNGARHPIDNITYLGGTIDSELDGQNSPRADGDDLDGNNDDDGVLFPDSLQSGKTATLSITASNAGLLNAWIDYNTDGDWADAGEQICTDQSLVSGVNHIPFTIPNSALTDSTIARFRFSTSGGLTYTGLAQDGEVEDYEIFINKDMVIGSDTIQYGEDTCWLALNSITIPESGGPFLVENGASVDIIAKNIVYVKNGFKAESGSYVHIFLSDTGCMMDPRTIVTAITYEESQKPVLDDIINIYPNPTTGEVNVLINTSEEISSVQIQIYSIWGTRILNNLMPPADLFKLNLSDYSKGIYIIRVEFNDQIQLRKIIKL